MLEMGKLKRNRPPHKRNRGREKPDDQAPNVQTQEFKARLRALKATRQLPQHRGNVPEPTSPPPEYTHNVPLQSILRPGDWAGRRCFLIGGGPSAATINPDLLSDELTIGINRAFERFPSTINVFMDVDLFGHMESGSLGPRNQNKWRDYPGIRVFWEGSHYLFPPRDADHPYTIYTVRAAGRLNWKSLDSLYAASNSGMLALNLALALGANPIYLIGFDMRGDGQGGQKWWHDGYPHRKQSEAIYPDFIDQFREVAPEIKRKKIDVINLNPDSALDCFPKANPGSILTQKTTTRTPTVVTFYTRNTPYEQEAQRLESSCRRFGIRFRSYATDSTGSWERNTQQKPQIIRQALDDTTEDILWVDADGTIMNQPTLFRNYQPDIGYPQVDWSKHSCGRNDTETLSGTIYFRNNKKVKSFVDAWIASTKRHPTWVDQQSFSATLRKWRKKLHTEMLPEQYCQIFDTMADTGEPIIEHYQASRRLRERV